MQVDPAQERLVASNAQSLAEVKVNPTLVPLAIYDSTARGYGHAAMVEVIRRLRLYPEVEMIATSHRRENVAAMRLYRTLGFVPWDVAWAGPADAEVFLRLPD